ncbi:MAG TPA: YraN family protein, partial [Stellaceae bacterium]
VVEVKSRGVLADAAAALSPRQRRRIARAAQAFLLTRPDLGGLDLRFDIMLAGGRRLPRHWPDAWRSEW